MTFIFVLIIEQNKHAVNNVMKRHVVRINNNFHIVSPQVVSKITPKNNFNKYFTVTGNTDVADVTTNRPHNQY